MPAKKATEFLNIMWSFKALHIASLDLPLMTSSLSFLAVSQILETDDEAEEEAHAEEEEEGEAVVAGAAAAGAVAVEVYKSAALNWK